MSCEARKGEPAPDGSLSRHVVGKIRELPPGLSKSLWAGGRRVALFNRAGELFATDASCPHMGADLGNGTVSGDTLTCAWHHWQFNLRTGEGLTRGWARLKCHRLLREGEDLILEIEDAPSEAAPEETHRAGGDSPE
jgi:nitrite reductase/ring-hydroxylating ferredoxin subunit